MTTLRRVQVGVPDSGSLSGLTTIRATTKDAQLSLADVIRRWVTQRGAGRKARNDRLAHLYWYRHA